MSMNSPFFRVFPFVLLGGFVMQNQRQFGQGTAKIIPSSGKNSVSCPKLCTNPTPLHGILHPILHPKVPACKGLFCVGCRKCRFFQKNFFWKRDSSLFLHHIPGESVCREILAYVSLCPESLFPGDASSACRRKPLNRRWETLIHGDTPCASKVCLRIVDTNMKNAYHQSTYFMKVAPGYSSFLWNITPVPKSNTHLFLSMK